MSAATVFPSPSLDSHEHEPFTGSGEQLAAELQWLELVLRERGAAAAADRSTQEPFDEFSGMYVSEREIASYAAWPSRTTGIAALSDRARRLRDALDARAAAAANGLRLERLVRRFGLRPVERHVLVCCMSPDWALRFQRYFAYVQNDVTRRRPTMQLLGELFADGDPSVAIRSLFAPDAPLIRDGLMSFPTDVPFPARQPVVADAVIEYLAGTTRAETALAAFASIREPRKEWPRGIWYRHHLDVALRLQARLAADGRLPTSYIAGPARSGKHLIASALATRAGVRLLRADCSAWCRAGTLTRESLRLLRRDALLHGCLIELAHCDALLDPAMSAERAALDGFLADNQGAGIILSGTATATDVTSAFSCPLAVFELPRPDVLDRIDLWREALSSSGLAGAEEVIETVATAFTFAPADIVRALDAYRTMSPERAGSALDAAALLQACRETSRHALHRFARRIVPRRGWSDLVLPDDTRAQLTEVCNAARWRRRVHAEWGFERKLAIGGGINVLFAGPSGVGKTMSAEIVAAELGLDLFAVDLSCIVSKYIGETEKNLSQVFDEAALSSAVLFFDECDALFGKRTEIRDAHDRYANIETNYLLQRIDGYEGIVILATNLRGNLDAALSRRIRYAIEFPFPDVPRREEIWRKVFPAEAPLGDDLDLAFLARQFKLAGGNIKNIAVNAAFLAASNGGQVGMKHVIHATRRELQKMGRSCTRAEFGRYFGWVRDAAPAAEAE